MDDDALNQNFEWKKKTFGKKERLSRRIDAQQATLFDANKKSNFTAPIPATAPSKERFSSHLKKMRKIIKNAVDDDDDDENEEIFVADPMIDELNRELNSNPLLQALSETEAKAARQQKLLDEIKQQQAAGKIAAINTLNTLAAQNGLPKLSKRAISENMQTNGWGNETFKGVLEREIAPNVKTGVFTPNPEKVQKLMKGLKRLKKIGGFSAVQGMKISEVIHITDTRHNDRKVAQLLLKKTGRKPNKSQDKRFNNKDKQPAKLSFKSLLKSKQEREATRV